MQGGSKEPVPSFENKKILAVVLNAGEYVLAGLPFQKSDPLMYEFLLASWTPFPNV